jgi:hypothetical protein
VVETSFALVILSVIKSGLMLPCAFISFVRMFCFVEFFTFSFSENTSDP